MSQWDGWKKINELPGWVKQARKQSHHSHYKGKNFIYKIEDGKYYMRRR